MFRNILFVCTGNICRSALAEYLLKDINQQKNLGLNVSSAGTGALIGYPADNHVLTLLKELSIDGTAHSARQLNKAIIHENDLILIMEKHHQRAIHKIAPEARGKVFLMGHWQQREIRDPFRQELSVFRTIQDEIREGMESWLTKALGKVQAT